MNKDELNKVFDWLEKNIKDIVTKEQFERKSYKAGE